MTTSVRHAYIVAGFGYGDECKGSITDYLARIHGVHTVIRYNGGAQAAHNVVLSDGRHHTFSQFGSASFIPGVRTHLSQFTLVNPLGMKIESDILATKNVTDASIRANIDERALIITPFHCSANRLREVARGNKRHGSCGQGVGETVRDANEHNDIAIKAADLTDLERFRRKLMVVQRAKLSEMSNIISCTRDDPKSRREALILTSPDMVDRLMPKYKAFVRSVEIVSDVNADAILRQEGSVIFEGAQGTLLDETFGFHPYVTWTNTTLANAEFMLRSSGYSGKVTRYGLFRAYFTRHGYGPFVSEDSELSLALQDTHNGMHEWQREFRVGWFDIIAARYAISVAGNVDGLAISCLDRFEKLHKWKICVGYYHPQYGYIEKIEPDSLGKQECLTKMLMECRPVYHTFRHRDIHEYLEFLEDKLQVPIALTSRGPTEMDKSSTQGR
jgi:adenylosuccinate synthase